MVVAEVTTAQARPVVGAADEAPRRQCGRCRMEFVPDEHGDVPTLTEWWVCEPCRVRLIPDWRR